MTAQHTRCFILAIATTTGAVAACTGEGRCEEKPEDPRCCQLCQNDPDQRLCYKNSEHNGICNEPTCDCTARPDGGTPDAGPQDAGPPCGGSCAAPTPACDETTNQCVECLGDTDCTNPAAPRCDNGTCTGCTADADCTRLTGTTICNTTTGACVACTETETAACTTGVCKPAGSCSQYTVNRGLCADCDTDRNCQTGMRCIATSFGGISTGAQCFWEQDSTEPFAPSGNCANVSPYVRAAATRSLDGANSTVCRLRGTTCAAFNDFGKPCSAPETGNDDCGRPMVDDGLCQNNNASPPQSRCTYRCTDNQDCRDTVTCNTGAIPIYCNLDPPEVTPIP